MIASFALGTTPGVSLAVASLLRLGTPRAAAALRVASLSAWTPAAGWLLPERLVPSRLAVWCPGAD